NYHVLPSGPLSTIRSGPSKFRWESISYAGMKIRELKCNGYERVIRADDDSAEYHSIIAIHNTRLGPAVGGTRLWRYDSEDDALHDCLRLARGMTFKSAFAGLPLGGGKSVIMSPANGKLNREEL